MLARIRFFSRDEERQPILLAAQADQKLRDMAASSNKIYIYELLAAVATVRQLRDRVWRGEVILFVGSEAACAASTKGAAEEIVALTLLYLLRAIAAQYDIAIWTERVPTCVNPASHPPRGRELTCATEPRQDLASINGFAPICDLSWMMFQRAD